MELAQHVAANLEIPESSAERGIGAVLNALQLSLPKETFELVKTALPDAERYMGRALMSAGRTAEIVAPIGPGGLIAALATAGIKREDMPRLGRIVLEHVRASVGDEAVTQFLTSAPALRD
jgi:hypothetical protein